MPRKTLLYPEGGVEMNIYVPVTVRDGMRRAAPEHRASVSQLATIILEDWLRRRGYLREPEAARA